MIHRLLLFLAFAVAACLACHAQNTDPEGISHGRPAASTAPPASAVKADAKPVHTIIEAPNGTFGYEIRSGGKLLVRQLNLPGLPGNNGCATKADAEKLAQLVIKKIENGEMPPTVKREELQALHIIR